MASSSSSSLLLISHLLCILFFVCNSAAAIKTSDNSEEWGYVEVRPSELFLIFIQNCFFFPLSFLNCFLVHGKCRSPYVLVALPESAAGRQRADPMADCPLVAGWTCEYSRTIRFCLSNSMEQTINQFPLSEQGASGVGTGNFEEIGPLNTDLKPRNTTWLQKADLLFVVSALFLLSFTSFELM